MGRTANFIHKCNKCGQEIIAYRNCNGEGHLACTEVIQGKKYCGELKLVQELDYDEAAKKGIEAVFFHN